MKKLTCINLLIIFGLAACNRQAPTATLLSVLSTPTFQPTLISPTTLIPTMTAPPTEAVILLSPSQIMEAVKQQNYKMLCDGKDLHPTISESPNGEWAAIPCNRFTKVFRMDGAESWKVSSGAISLPDERLKKLDLFISHWSSDQKYIYYPYKTTAYGSE